MPVQNNPSHSNPKSSPRRPVCTITLQDGGTANLDTFLAQGGDPNLRVDRCSLLVQCALHQQWENVTKLLNRPEIDVARAVDDRSRHTVLTVLASDEKLTEEEQVNLGKLILENIQDDKTINKFVNHSTSEDGTALMIALGNERYRFVSLLKKHGALIGNGTTDDAGIF